MRVMNRTQGGRSRLGPSARGAIFLSVVALGLAACGTDDDPTAETDDDPAAETDDDAADPGELDEVVVGGTMGGSDVAFFVADARGYFEEEGIEIDLVQFSSASDMIPAVGSGELDVAGGAPSAGLLNSIARDINLQIVADKGSNVPGQGYFSLVVRADLVESGEFSDFSDLQGRTIAFTGAGNTTQAMVYEALQTEGIEFDDANITDEFLGFGEMVTALDNESVDAATLIEPFVTAAVDMGAGVAFPGDEFYPNQQVAVVMYGEEFIARGDDLGTRFMKAYIRGARDYNDAIEDGALDGPGADEIIDILIEYTAQDDPDVYRRAGPAGLNPDGAVNLEGLQRDFDFWESQDLIEEGVSVEDAVDTSFVEAALEELGEYEGAG